MFILILFPFTAFDSKKAVKLWIFFLIRKKMTKAHSQSKYRKRERRILLKGAHCLTIIWMDLAGVMRCFPFGSHKLIFILLHALPLSGRTLKTAWNFSNHILPCWGPFWLQGLRVSVGSIIFVILSSSYKELVLVNIVCCTVSWHPPQKHTNPILAVTPKKGGLLVLWVLSF